MLSPGLPFIKCLLSSVDVRCFLGGTARVQRGALLTFSRRFMCPPGSVNCGPGIYGASLPRRHKALVFINVNAPDLYLSVKLYVAVERCVNEEGRDGMDRQTDGWRRGRRWRLRGGGGRFPMTPPSSPFVSFLATFVTRGCRFCRRSITDVTRRSCRTTPG